MDDEVEEIAFEGAPVSKGHSFTGLGDDGHKAAPKPAPSPAPAPHPHPHRLPHPPPGPMRARISCRPR